MIPLRIACAECGALSPLHVATYGYHSLNCSGCGAWLDVEATPDSLAGKVATAEPKRRWMPWVR